MDKGAQTAKKGGMTAWLNRRGELALNRPAMDALGCPPAIILFYDEDKMVIGAGRLLTSSIMRSRSGRR